MRRRLLLADDSVTIQRVIELTFAGEDVEVITVHDGEQAIARIPVDKPDIVLADIGMPRRSGYDVCAFVKDRPDLAHVPVLLLAGAFEPVDDARVRQVRGDGVLVKPFEPQQVIARVRELIDRRGDAAATGAPGTLSPPDEAPPPDGLPAPTPSPDPALARPEIGVVGPTAPDSSLDQYFDRLDAAFATLGGTHAGGESPIAMHEMFPESAPPPPADGSFAVPTIDDLLGGGTRGAVAEAPATGGSHNVIVDAFQALLAVERGEADPTAVRRGPPAGRAEVTDDLVDEVTRRVLARLAPDAARTVVADVVSDVAERLVREEIERIRRRV